MKSDRILTIMVAITKGCREMTAPLLLYRIRGAKSVFTNYVWYIAPNSQPKAELSQIYGIWAYRKK